MAKMTDKQWREILQIAEELGEDCHKTIDGLGKRQYELMRNKLIRQSVSHEEKSTTEWIIAMWRYHKAVGGKSFNDRELDKIAHWAFYLLWLQGRITEQFQSLTLASGELEDNKNIKEMRATITGLDNFAKEVGSIEDMLEEFFERVETMDKLAVKGYSRRVIDKMEDLFNESTKLAKNTRQAVNAIEDLARLANVDTQQVTSKRTSLETVAKQIDAIESELNLRVQHGSGSKEMWVSALLNKADRYVKDNPRLFTWHCPECEWEGILAQRHPPEGAVFNAMSKHWTWRCPDCGVMLAYDRRHPQYEQCGKQAIVFNLHLWEALCNKESLSLVMMAKFLGTDPEWIIHAADIFLGLEVPEHVQKEFEQREKDFVSNRDDEDLPETGGMPEESDGEDGE